MNALQAVEGRGSQPIRDPREDLVLELAQGLHDGGAPAHRLEALIGGVAERVGLEVRVFSTPTAIYASFGPHWQGRMALLCTSAPSMDLGKLADMAELVDQISAGTLTPDEATPLLRGVLERSERYPRWARLIAYALTSAAAVVLFGGGVGELIGAAFTGLAVGTLGEFVGPRPRLRPVFELSGALMAGLLAGLWGAFVPADPQLVTLASLVALLPGLSLTTAMTELATGHLASGTARLAGALISFANLAMGTTVALHATEGLNQVGSMVPLPFDGTGPALLVASLTFVVLMRARGTDLVWVVLACTVAWFVGKLGGSLVGPVYGAALAAFVLTLVANATAHARRQPASVLIIPGMFLLVPGLIGLQGLTALYGADLVGGLQAAVTASLTAIALATGVLVAHVVLPPRRVL